MAGGYNGSLFMFHLLWRNPFQLMIIGEFYIVNIDIENATMFIVYNFALSMCNEIVFV